MVSREGWYRLYHALLQATGAWQVPLGVPGAQGPQPWLSAAPPRRGHQSRTQLPVSVLSHWHKAAASQAVLSVIDSHTTPSFTRMEKYIVGSVVVSGIIS